MSTAPGSPLAGQAPGVVKVRLSGDLPDLAILAALLASHPAIEILTGPDGPQANRREPGARVYLTVRVPAPSAGAGAQPPSKPSAPACPPRRRVLPS
jgi:hypothetical protein